MDSIVIPAQAGIQKNVAAGLPHSRQ